MQLSALQVLRRLATSSGKRRRGISVHIAIVPAEDHRRDHMCRLMRSATRAGVGVLGGASSGAGRRRRGVHAERLLRVPQSRLL